MTTQRAPFPYFGGKSLAAAVGRLARSVRPTQAARR
jgi:hypothetical protein